MKCPFCTNDDKRMMEKIETIDRGSYIEEFYLCSVCSKTHTIQIKKGDGI